MVSKGRKPAPLVQIERDPAKFSELDILTSTVAINKYHGETSAGQNSAQRGMVPEPRKPVSTILDRLRWINSNRFDYLEPIVRPLLVVALVEWVLILLLVVVP